LLHLAAIRVDRPVHEMMIFAKSLLCSFLRLGAGVGESLEGVLAGVDFVAISAKHLLKESYTKAAHCDLHCLLGHNKRILERIFDLPQRCARERAESHPENLIRPGRFFAWPRTKPMEGSVCSPCHVVAPLPAPSFMDIAKSQYGSLAPLESLLRSTHSDVGHPGGMPNISLSREQIGTISAYIGRFARSTLAFRLRALLPLCSSFVAKESV
jgi:hypothetical protein